MFIVILGFIFLALVYVTLLRDTPSMLLQAMALREVMQVSTSLEA